MVKSIVLIKIHETTVWFLTCQLSWMAGRRMLLFTSPLSRTTWKISPAICSPRLLIQTLRSSKDFRIRLAREKLLSAITQFQSESLPWNPWKPIFVRIKFLPAWKQNLHKIKKCNRLLFFFVQGHMLIPFVYIENYSALPSKCVVTIV